MFLRVILKNNKLWFKDKMSELINEKEKTICNGRVVDLFAGCGGLSKGFESAGFEIAAAFELNPYAVECYNQNFSEHEAYQFDLADVESSVERIKPFSPSIIIGGPPCQDFSVAGSRIEGDRAVLTECFAKICAKVKPEYFVMENVPRAKDSQSYFSAKNLLIKAGYGLTEKVVDASLYGVPQKRKRFIVVGQLGAADGFLDEILESRESIVPMTVRAKYPDFPVDYYYRHPRTYQRRAVFSIDEPAPTMRGVNRPRPASYKAHKNDCSNSKEIRSLSFSERALIQTFPPDFRWVGPNVGEIELMIGNAVPVDLAKSLALSLKDFIYSDTSNYSESFACWLKDKKSIPSGGIKAIILHLRRANRYLSLPANECADYIEALSLKEDFSQLSNSTKLHTYRALQLLFEFRLDRTEQRGQ